MEGRKKLFAHAVELEEMVVNGEVSNHHIRDVLEISRTLKKMASDRKFVFPEETTFVDEKQRIDSINKKYEGELN